MPIHTIILGGVLMKGKMLKVAPLGAILFVSPLAMADNSNVELYGRVNTSFERTKIQDGVSRNQVVDNRSRIGFRGKEDLGGGLTAIFQVENATPVDRGGGTFASRDSWIGLAGGFGTFKIGRMIGPVYYGTADWVAQHNHDTGTSEDALFNGGFYSTAYPAPYGDERNNNTVYYSTPSFNGFKFEANYSTLTESANKPHESEYAASYDKGPLHATLGYGQTKNYSTAAGADSVGRKDKGWIGAIHYDFKSFTLAALADRSKVELPAGTSATRNYYRISGMVPIGSNEFHLNYGIAKDLSGTSNTGAKQWTLAYNYKLSKRTKLYALYTKVDNDPVDAAVAGSGGRYALVNSDPGTPIGKDVSSFGVGVRHNF